MDVFFIQSSHYNYKIDKMVDSNSFFIISSARSGSTSLATILDMATNADCVSEPMPNLNHESREMLEGRIKDPTEIVQSTIVNRVNQNYRKGRIYGEKNVSYAPFIPQIYEQLKCKFVFLKRDGRDVVRSMIDWHDNMFGDIYRECKDPGNLSSDALNAASELLVHKDTSDYSRPRPLPGTKLFTKWEDLSRFEMCAYYWSFINELYLDQLNTIPNTSWIELDYTNPRQEDITKVASFLGLKGLSKTQISNKLNKKINSLKDRKNMENKYPNWKKWDSGLREKYDIIATDTMKKLGYYNKVKNKWKPSNYGYYWNKETSNLEWYMWMYNSRLKMHKDLIQWVYNKEKNGERIDSIADIGCGLGVGYSEEFTNKTYVGVDISPKNIEWCKHNRKNPTHSYVTDLSYLKNQLKFDLVFSSGTIDNSHDITHFLKNMVKNTNKWIYITCYRGWFPDLKEHVYSWNESHGCFYNDISPTKIHNTLSMLNCTDIEIKKTKTNNKNILFETLIIAKKGGDIIGE
jgi:SAM-dependent methyltransferase